MEGAEQSDRTSVVTVRRLLLSLFFFGCAFAAWRLPWGADILATAELLLLLFTCLGAAVGAPFGHWWRGAAVGIGAALVAMSFWVPIFFFGV